jgi:hypothetical protein
LVGLVLGCLGFELARVFLGHIEVVSQMLFEPLPAGDVEKLAGAAGADPDQMRSTPPRSATRRRRRS